MESLNVLADPLILRISYGCEPYSIISPNINEYKINGKKVDYEEAKEFLSKVLLISSSRITLEDKYKDVYYKYTNNPDVNIPIDYAKLTILAENNPKYAKRLALQLDRNTRNKFSRYTDMRKFYEDRLSKINSRKKDWKKKIDEAKSEKEKDYYIRISKNEEDMIYSGIRKSERKTNLLSAYTPRISSMTKNWYTNIDRSLTKIIECDYKTFEDLWNDKENYGPIVASCCYNGCMANKIPMPSLMSTWTRLKNEMESIEPEKRNFMDIYKYFIQKEKLDYTFCNGKYNFLVDFYEQGLCNCECGSYLCMAINFCFPDSKNVVFGVKTKHVCVLMPFLKEEKLFIENFETTKFGEIYLEKIENVLMIMVSEQVIGMSILFNSSLNRADEKIFSNVFERMLQIKLSQNILVILRTCKRPTITNYLDSNSFDMIITKFFLYNRYKDKIFRSMELIRNNNKKYLENDLLHFTEGKEVSEFELSERIMQHSKEIYDIIKA